MIYFFSDSHLGLDSEAQQQKLVRMLRRMATDAEAIYILGDLFDYWYEYLWPDRSKEAYATILNELHRIVDSGIPVHFYTGNHDLWTFGELAKRSGMIVHKTRLDTITLYGKRIVLGHGDGLVPNGYLETLPEEVRGKVKKSIRINRLFHNPVAQAVFRLCPPALGNRLGYNWACQNRTKEQTTPIPYKGENKEELVLWAKEASLPQPLSPKGERGADYFIFGHRHIELELELVSRARIILLGDTFVQWTYARLTPDGLITTELYED